jgi:hypothetical protein
MSTLKVATIQDTSGNNSSTPAGIASGTAKAWVNFNGDGTVAIRDNFNVSSITDNGTGDYTVTFTTAMASADYCVTGGASDTGSGAGYRWLGIGSNHHSDFSKTTSSVRVQPVYTSSDKNDAAHVYVIIFGA